MSDLEGSEIEIIKQVQAQAFHEISIVQAKKRLPKSSKLAKLQSFIDPVGILKISGRIQKAPVNYKSRHPILLPSVHHVTPLIIKDHHRFVWYSRMSNTWTSLRLRFWVIKGALTVRGVSGKCIFCKKQWPTINGGITTGTFDSL